MTDVEKLHWSHLRNRGLHGHKFLPQVQIGNAVADFACRSGRLVVELDGGQHAGACEADAGRTRMIEEYGYRVVRFWNSDVTENLDGVLERLAQELRIATR